MNLWKTVRYAALMFFAASGAVLYTACQKDACERIRCQYGGSCRDGYCTCRTGYEGQQCEVLTASKFIGTYYGYLHRDGDESFVSLLDTIDIGLVSMPDTVFVRRRGMDRGDTLYGRTVGDNIVIAERHEGFMTYKYEVKIEPFTDSTKITFWERRYNDTTTDGHIADVVYAFRRK